MCSVDGPSRNSVMRYMSTCPEGIVSIVGCLVVSEKQIGLALRDCSA